MESLLKEPVWTVNPGPAFCVKTRKLPPSGTGKVFINFCTCDELPPPRDISESDLATILESENPGSYKIPISLSDGHEELSKSGETCTAYDVIVNKKFYEEKIIGSELFRTFVIAVAVDALYNKYKVKVDNDNWIVLKNRKHVGDIKSQQIRKNAKPMIVELEDESPTTPAVEKHLKFTLMKDSARNPTKILGKFYLPDAVDKLSDLTLDVSRDRILIKNKEINVLDICIPFDIEVEKVSAAFSTKHKTLTVEFPLVT